MAPKRRIRYKKITGTIKRVVVIGDKRSEDKRQSATGIVYNDKVRSSNQAAALVFGEYAKKFGNLSGGSAILSPVSAKINVIINSPRRNTSLEDYYKGIQVLMKVLRSSKIMAEIRKTVFASTITPVLKRLWARAGGFDFHTTGQGKALRFDHVTGQAITASGTKEYRIRYKHQRAETEFSEAGKRVGNILIDPKSISSFAGGGTGISLRDLLNQKLDSPSKYNSAFMILEFGTGKYAVPYPRLYAGDATPYKVKSGTPFNPPAGAWFLSTKLASDLAADAAKITQYNRLKQRFEATRSGPQSRALLEQMKALQVGKFKPYADLWMIGRKPRPTIFTQKGIAQEIIRAFDLLPAKIVAAINKRVQQEVPRWPGIGTVSNLPKQPLRLLRTARISL